MFATADVIPVRLQLDLWYVILNGAVEISHEDGRVETLCMGNSFGISPSLAKQYMSGAVCSKGDDCQVRSAPLFLVRPSLLAPPVCSCLLLLFPLLFYHYFCCEINP